jgi:predicted dehydrogenase
MASRQPSPADSWYRQPNQAGGGILTHSGSHLIDVIRFLLGEPVRVDARVREAPDVPGLDLATQALIDLANGTSVQFSAISAPAAILGHSGEGWEEIVDVIGTHGRVRLSSPNWQGTAPCLVTLQLIGELETRTFRPEPGSQWTAELRSFLNAVSTRCAASPGVIDGYRVDAVLAALYESGRRHAPVDICTDLQRLSEPLPIPAKGGPTLNQS